MKLFAANRHLGVLFGFWVGVRQLHKSRGRSKTVYELYK